MPRILLLFWMKQYCVKCQVRNSKQKLKIKDHEKETKNLFYIYIIHHIVLTVFANPSSSHFSHSSLHMLPCLLTSVFLKISYIPLLFSYFCCWFDDSSLMFCNSVFKIFCLYQISSWYFFNNGHSVFYTFTRFSLHMLFLLTYPNLLSILESIHKYIFICYYFDFLYAFIHRNRQYSTYYFTAKI